MTENNFIESGIIDVDIDKKMRSSYLDYSMSVIVARALPDVRDGLKPVHRRIIYGMQELNLASNGPYRKSARLVGDVMGKFHPHGDSSIYDATVRLAQDFSTRYPLVDGQGNFGNIDGDGAAAMRYTEVKMTKLAEEMLRDIKKDTVDFVPNFDESETEPTILPSRFPNLIVNGSSGIAVGMATNMAPHNMNEAIDGVIAYIDNDNISIDELNEIIKGPDFPTGAQIMGTEGIKKAYKTGRGKITVRAIAEIKNVKKRDQIVITELPYQVNKSALVMKIADLAKNKEIEGISNITDASNKKGINIIIDLKRDANAEVVLNKLYKNTQMQITFGIINLALVNGKPEILNLKDLIRHYVDHQVEVVTRRTVFDLNKAEARAHIIEGLFIALDNIDRIIKIVRGSKDDKEAKEKFHEEFGLTDAQSQAILDMRIRRLTGLERERLQEEYDKLQADIKWFKEILDNNEVLMNLIKEELTEIKEKYGDLRRTIISSEDNTDIEIEDIIKKEDVVITLTQFGYIKRMSEGTYKPQKRGGRGVSSGNMREDDFVKELFVTSTHDMILFFTSLGNVFKLKAYEIPQDSRTSRGTAIVNLLDLEENEKISSIIPVKEYDPELNFLMVTENGIIKRTSFKEYKNIRKSGIIAIKLNEGDRLINVHLTKNDENVILVTKKGLSIRFSEEQVRKSGRNSIGVKSIELSKDDKVVSSDIADDNKYLLVVSENGYGKLTELSNYKVQNRGGKGILTYKITKKTGDVASASVVDKEDDIMIIADSGIIIRILTDDISVQGRNTSGVKLMNLKDSKVVAVARYIGD